MSDYEKCIDFPITKTDDNPTEEVENAEPKDGEISNLPRTTLIQRIDKVEIENETATLINYLSALVLSASDYLFEYSVDRGTDPDRAEMAFTKGMMLLEIAEPLARKYIDLSE